MRVQELEERVRQKTPLLPEVWSPRERRAGAILMVRDELQADLERALEAVTDTKERVSVVTPQRRSITIEAVTTAISLEAVTMATAALALFNSVYR